MTAPIPVVLCGREPSLSAAFVAHMLPEYDVLHVCHSLSAAQTELPPLFRGDTIPASSGLGSNSTAASSAPNLSPRIPVAIICGGGFPPTEVSALGATPGLERVPVFAADQRWVRERVQAGLGPPGVEDIVRRVKGALGRGYEGVGVREW